MKLRLIALGLLASAAWTGHAAALDAPARAALRDTGRTPEQRAEAVIAAMTIEEKAAQLGHTAPAIPRLGVPQYNWWNEGCTASPAPASPRSSQAIGMAASWDAPLMRKVADTISTEFRAKYVERLHPDGGSDFYRGLTVWSPNINIFRDPRWGRGQETYGEDPHLTGRIGIAFIQGLQGSDPNYFKTIATSKHFAVHSGPESNRHKEDVHPSLYDLEDTYLPAFRATVTEGGVQSIMCVYNAIDGVPGCANDRLMETYLRQSWGFKGYVVSDCGAAANIYREDSLHYAKTPEAGVALGFKAGMDLICGDYRNHMTTDADSIVRAVKAGLLPEAVVDRSLVRLFAARIRLGMFDPPASLPWTRVTAADNATAEHRAVSREMAKASMVLLKNDGLLPIKGSPRTIAVIGPNADSLDTLVGNYYGTPAQPVTVLEGIRARWPQAKVLHVEGSGLVGPAEQPVPDNALCADAACVAPGLRAEVFAGTDLEGSPVGAKTVPNAATEWRGDREASIRWTGFLKAPETGTFHFRLLSENGYRVFVGGKEVVDEWGVGDSPSILSGTTMLEAGKIYPIRVEGFQRGARGFQKLVWSPPGADGDDAVDAAKQADLVIFAGASARIEGEEMKLKADGFAGGDRTSLDLPAPQQKLLERVVAAGKPVVLVLMNGSAMSVNWADKHVPAIIEAWYPGEQGGHAVAQLIAGDYSPAGRLPVTFYKSAADLPPFSDYAMKGRTYRYFTGAPLYAFGHGLSYTRFTYGAAKLSASRINANGEVTVTLDVTNSGAMDGDEVVQLYVTHPGTAGAPIRALQGFQRVHLKKGETRPVSFRLEDRALSLVDAQGVRQVRPGTIDLWIGGGQPGEGVAGSKASFEVTGSLVLPR